MCPSQDLDRLSIGRVASDLAMVMPIGADQIGQQLGIGGIGLGP